MPIVRFEPGETAPDTGTYALVGHYGESAGIAQRFNEGDRLPLAAAEVEYPLWYVLIADEAAQAA